MTDAEYTFNQISAERKRIGRGAIARKCGSKSKKCSLPSDLMTASEIKKMSGECKSYDLSKPMKWGEFRKLPHDLQSEYIKKLAAMGANRADVCDMFGVKPDTYSQYMIDHHKGERFFTTKNAKYKNNDEFVAWFCGESGIEVAENKPTEAPTVAEEQAAVNPVETVEEKTAMPVLSSGSVTYTGNPKAIFDKIMLMMDGIDSCKITVSFEQTAA